MQVETSIRLENASGQAGTSADASARQVPTIQGGASISGSGVNNGGEQAGQLPQSMGLDDEQRFTGRIVRGLSTMINQRGGSMTMRLDPPELGQLRVQMTIIRGVVSAQFTASTAQAHALLDKNISSLRLALESQGLTVERLTVNATPTNSHQQAMNDHASDKHHHQHQRNDAGGEQSRGRREQSASQHQPQTPQTFAGVLTMPDESQGEPL